MVENEMHKNFKYKYANTQIGLKPVFFLIKINNFLNYQRHLIFSSVQHSWACEVSISLLWKWDQRKNMEKSYLHAFTKFWVCKLLSDNMFLLLRKEIKERIHKYFTKTYNHFWEHAFNIQGASPQFWDKTSTKFICKFSDALIQKFCCFYFFLNSCITSTYI